MRKRAGFIKRTQPHSTEKEGFEPSRLLQPTGCLLYTSLKQIHSLGDEQYKRLMAYMKALQKLEQMESIVAVSYTHLDVYKRQGR